MKKRIRKLRGIVSIVRLVRDPDRLDEVFELAESMGDAAILSQMAAAFAEDPEGARALEERPRIGPISVQELRKLPVGTLGRTFAEHMIANGLDPAAIPSIESHDTCPTCAPISTRRTTSGMPSPASVPMSRASSGYRPSGLRSSPRG